jgi:Porin subfamily
MASFMVALRRQKTGGYAARKVIPKDVREEYARLYGVGWEEKLSLPPGCSAHEAKARCGEWLAELETRIGALRAQKSGKAQPLTRRNAHALAGRWYSWFISSHATDLRTPKHWRSMSNHLVWDVIHPHAPDEYHQDTKADPEWEWKAHPEVRAAVRPVIATEARTAYFLLEQGVSLTPEASDLFLDAVEDNLLAAYVRLEGLARGDYGPDALMDQFPEYVSCSLEANPTIGCWKLFKLVEAYGFRGAFNHNWDPYWSSSLWGGVAAVRYNGTAGVGVGAGDLTSAKGQWCASYIAANKLTAANTSADFQCNPDYNVFMVGVVTRWTPVKNLTFSAEVQYFHLDQKFTGTATLTPSAPKPTAVYEYKDQDTVALNVRVQRNF